MVWSLVKGNTQVEWEKYLFCVFNFDEPVLQCSTPVLHSSGPVLSLQSREFTYPTSSAYTVDSLVLPQSSTTKTDTIHWQRLKGVHIVLSAWCGHCPQKPQEEGKEP